MCHEYSTDDFNKFLKGIVSIPKDRKFEEKIKSYNIQIDGPMANAWTGYEFWIDGQMHHCGVNSFQLFNDGTGWRLFISSIRVGQPGANDFGS